jgi:alkanesulfonate monooxygenase SsuD/methylene tetrahydromethanopterin reductase-like flavin-dependent oxidoreductase (luciferase family)
MRLGYFTMPVHPMSRNMTETLQEDRQEIIFADQLGFYDCFVGEHLADTIENVPSSMIFLASLISDTKTIKLGTGTSNLSQNHPVLTACHAALLDHLAQGRFIFGISPGSLPTDAEALGTLALDRNKLFVEAIDVILEVWRRDYPYDIDLPDNRFKVSTARTGAPHLGTGQFAKPYQRPHPEIVGTVVAPESKGAIEMGKRDFHPLSANFLLAKWLRSHWVSYAEGKAAVGQVADTGDWRIARTIFVADDDATAERYAISDPKSPYRFYYYQMLTKLRRANKHRSFQAYPDQPDEEITIDSVMKELVLYGSVNRVVDQILQLREIAGDFGEIVYAGMDHVDPALAKRSMELMATEVMPRVRDAIKTRGASK